MKYTSEEVQLIEEYLGRFSLEVISKKIGRPVDSIILTMTRKKGHCNTKLATGMITAGELSRAIGVDRNTVVGWIEKHGLKFTRRVTRTTKVFTFIRVEDFWEWAENNKEKIDFSKIPPNSLPPEPEFVSTERLKNQKKINYKPWTIKEEQYLMQLKEQGYSYKEISKRLHRQPCAVMKKYSRLARTEG